MLGQRHDHQHPLLRQVLQQRVHVGHDVLAVGQRLEIAAQAVDHHQPHALPHPVDHGAGELPGRDLGGIEMRQVQGPRRHVVLDIQPHAGRARAEHLRPLLEQEHRRGDAAVRRRARQQRGEGGLPRPRLPRDQQRGPELDAPAQQPRQRRVRRR